MEILLKFNVQVQHQKMKEKFNGILIIEYVLILILTQTKHTFKISVFSFLMMKNQFIHAEKLFIFVLFQDLIWDIIVVQFRIVIM